MSYKRLYIWAEGIDDERFFEKIIEPKLQEQYDYIKIVRYSNMKGEKVKDFLKSIKSIMDADYFFITDIDKSPCVSAKKEEIENIIDIDIDKEKIVVVIKEIESWYLAGLDTTKFKKIKIRHFERTDNISKEDFNKLISGNSRVNFMIEILNNFSIEMAKQRNKSFKYFIEKIQL
jgi:hypothetical protein